MAIEDPSDSWRRDVGPSGMPDPWLERVHAADQLATANELRFADEERDARHREYLKREAVRSSISRVVAVAVSGLLIVGLAAAVAYVVSNRMDKVYAARAQLQLVMPADSSGDNASRVLMSEALAVRSRSVLDRTAAATNVSTEDLDDQVKSRVLPNSEIIEVDIEHRDPAIALVTLKQLISDYLAPATPGAESPASAFITSQISAIDQQIAELDLRLAALPPNINSRESLQLGTERSGLIARRDLLLQISLEMAIRKLASADVTLLAAPYLLEDPVSPQPVRASVLAAAVGAIISALMAYVVLRRPALR